jgi:predicted transposase/invertase (TIGR01784 family)
MKGKFPIFASAKMIMETGSKYLNPLTDFGFKKLFGTEMNKDLLIDFLNQLLPDKHAIKDLRYTNTEQLGAVPADRKAIFDLYCTGENGERFIVEIQKAKQNYFRDRSVYYSTFPIREQAEKGDWDFQLAAVYTVGILDFVFADHKSDEELLHVVKLKDQDCRVFYDKLTYIYLELPKFKKGEDELETRFEKWLYVLRHLSQLQDRPAKLQERVFQRLFEAAAIANFTPGELTQYEESLKYYRDIKNVVDTAMQEGEIKGKIEGKIEGMQQRSLEVARNLKKAGVAVDIIVQSTGLSAEEIEAL